MINQLRVGSNQSARLLSDVEWACALDVAKDADVLVVLTSNEFRALDLKRVRQIVSGNVLVDLRNLYPEALAEEAAFIYSCVGCTRL